MYSSFISDHEILPVTSVMEAMRTRTVSKLTTDVKTGKFIAIKRKTIEEALKALNTGAKYRAHNKDLRLQKEYMSTPKTRITIHAVSMYISKDHLGAFFSDFGPVEEVSSIKSRAGFATSDYKVMVTLTRPKFNEFPNVITSCGRNIYVVAEGHRPNC